MSKALVRAGLEGCARQSLKLNWDRQMSDSCPGISLSELAGKGLEMLLGEIEMSKRVRELRHRIGLTQERFAARLGVSFPTINRWENGKAEPSPLALRQIEALALELGVRRHEFQPALRRQV
jgi:DNA-binding transcriptional regulator YiaG